MPDSRLTKSRMLSDTPIEVQVERMGTLFEFLIVIEYISRGYELLTAKHNC